MPSICRYGVVAVVDVVVVVDVVDPVGVLVPKEVDAAVVVVVGVEDVDVVDVEDVVVSRSLVSSWKVASLKAISRSLSAMLPDILAMLSLISASSADGGVVNLFLKSDLS